MTNLRMHYYWLETTRSRVQYGIGLAWPMPTTTPNKRTAYLNGEPPLHHSASVVFGINAPARSSVTNPTYAAD